MIRKGKTILLFEFELDASYLATKEDKEQKGTIKIQEFNQEEIDDINIMAEPKEDSEDAYKIKMFWQREAKQHIVQLVRVFHNEFKELESNQAKLVENQNRRKEEEEKRKQAVEENSSEQERLSKLAQEREEVLKKAAQQSQPQQVQSQPDEKAQGSVWNTGSYFWEEKSVNWAADRLKSLIKEIRFDIPAGNITITEVDLQGDASVSIRKAKKIVTYSYIIDVSWIAKIYDGEGNELRSIKGKVHLPDVSMDCEPNFEVQIKVDEPSPENELIKYYMDAQGKPGILSQISKLIQELRNS